MSVYKDPSINYIYSISGKRCMANTTARWMDKWDEAFGDYTADDDLLTSLNLLIRINVRQTNISNNMEVNVIISHLNIFKSQNYQHVMVKYNSLISHFALINSVYVNIYTRKTIILHYTYNFIKSTSVERTPFKELLVSNKHEHTNGAISFYK